MVYWYVDFENVQSRIIQLATHVKRYDRVVIAYSDATKNIQCDALAALLTKNVKLEMFRCLNGSDSAMDFQIMMLIATNCANGVGTAHRVFSNDTDYMIPCQAWSARGYDVSLVRPDAMSRAEAEIKLKDLGLPRDTMLQCLACVEPAKRSTNPSHDLNNRISKYSLGKKQGKVHGILKLML